MNTADLYEISLLILIAILSVFLFESFLAKAFKTFIICLIVFVGLILYGTKKFNKFVPYKDSTVKDVKINYDKIKKEF
jgi:hypothetical protein